MMNEVAKRDVQFNPSGEESLTTYRGMSWMAMLAFALGLLSAFSLLHWLLLSIAIAAVMVALIALRQIAARPRELMGRKLALLGIALAVFFFGFGTSREVSRRNIVGKQARERAEHWLALLQDGSLPSLYQAFELQKMYEQRQPEGTDLALRYGDPKQFQKIAGMADDPEMRSDYAPRNDFFNFLQRPVVKQVVEAGKDCEFEFVGIIGRNSKSIQDLVTLEYRMQRSNDGKSREMPVFIKMSRIYYRDIREAHWSVLSVARKLEDL